MASVSKWHGNNLPVIKKRLAFVVLVFEIEILCGIFLKCFDRTDAVTAAAYHNQVDMGASTGRPGKSYHNGTLGGFVKLEDGRQFGLGNNHVVCNDQLNRSKLSLASLNICC
jgi:hypothetical protein